jgi:hypothetical protein
VYRKIAFRWSVPNPKMPVDETFRFFLAAEFEKLKSSESLREVLTQFKAHQSSDSCIFQHHHQPLYIIPILAPFSKRKKKKN